MLAKICGITRTADAQHAVASGATALGFVFWPASPRRVTPEQARVVIAALPSGVLAVGVFVNAPLSELHRTAEIAGLTAIQLHGDETAALAKQLEWPVWRAATLKTADGLADWPDDTTVVLDAHDPVRRGGTGATIDWVGASRLARSRRVVLAGGLTPSNVGEAIDVVRPFGVDVSSGVEVAPGVKDPGKVADFLSNARRAFAIYQKDV